MSELITCSLCGCEIKEEDYEAEDEYLCESCYYDETFRCECCGQRFFLSHQFGDDNVDLCEHCYNEHYYSCTRCERLVYSEDVYWEGEDPYCHDCYEEDYDDTYIHSYCYKPEPRFCKCRNEKKIRYYGVELEIDKGGCEEEFAEELYYIANECDDVLYIKSDGSLDSGMELVSHPCSLKYHRQKFPWEEIMHKAIRLGYRSHNTSTCGLHVHIGRKQLGEYIEEQEDVISRILFFFESHWNELFKFSRRSEYSIDRWAARQGYSDRPKDILEKAKTSSKGRYACVNVTNYSTVEIRMFRGTLKYNTFIATLELVDSICENAVRLTDEEMHKQSWNDFVMSLDPDYEELVQYLKERRLYVNEPINIEEEV